MLTRSEQIRRYVAKLPASQRANLMALATPRMVEPYIKHIPHPTQQLFLSLNDRREVLFGGAAGGGKSDALLMGALQYVDVPGYAALILRRTWPDLVLPGAIMDRAAQWLTDTPAQKRDGGRLWEFPSGAKLQFGYLQHDNSKYRYASAEFQYVGFDELTQFPEETTFEFLHSRIRRPMLACLNCNENIGRYRNPNGSIDYKHTTMKGKTRCKQVFPDPKVLAQYTAASDGTTIFEVPLRMRAATNPGGKGMVWVKERFIDARTKRKKSLFVPSKLTDNPSLDAESYRESLSFLGVVDRERLENGDWDIMEAGDMFDRSDFNFIKDIPTNVVEWVRFWDKAATENQSSDWTVGALVGLTDDDRIVIADIIRKKYAPGKVETLMTSTAQVDGQYVRIREEKEPGSSGITVIEHNRRLLMGYDYDGIGSSGSKATRAASLASTVKGRRVDVVVASWVRDMLDEFETFPNGAHDDQVDSVAGAFNELMFGARARLLV